MSIAEEGPPEIPALGMLIDRTSFDVDDFGVDRAALELAEMNGRDSPNADSEQVSRAVVMKDGRIRRRLRWRPKGMMKKRSLAKLQHQQQLAQQQEQHPDRDIAKTNSNCNASVVSGGASVGSGGNNSQYSGASKKSFHSFASTETMVKSNTKTNGRRLFPLPRPNYPKSFDGVSTIGSEADMVHARINSGTRASPLTVNANEDPTIKEEEDDRPQTAKMRNPPQLLSSMSTASSEKPPLFRRRPESTSPTPKISGSKGRLSPAASSTTPSAPSSPVSAAASPPVTPRATAKQPEPPLPALEDEEMEKDRRCDLRIPSPEKRDSSESGVRNSMSLEVMSLPATLEGAIHPGCLDDVWSSSLDGRPSTAKSVHVPPRMQVSTEHLRRPLTALGTINFSYSSPAATGHVKTPIVTPSLSDPLGGRLDQDLDDESDSSSFDDDNTMSLPTIGNASVASETRFSMSDNDDAKSVSSKRSTRSRRSQQESGQDDMRTPPSPLQEDGESERRSKTVPVDVDDGCFLEVEKNLQAIHDMANEHLQHGEFDEASEVFEEILRGQLARYGEDHYRVGTAYHNIGIVNMRRGDYSQAINAYREAVRVRKSALGPEHPDVAVSLAQLGVAYLESQRHRKAICVFREALKIRRRSLGNRHPKVAKILNNIGCALYDINELEVAMVAFLEALDIQRKLLRDSPLESLSLSENSLLSLASTQSNIASIKLYNGKFDEASVDLEEVLLIQQCVLGDDHPTVQKTQSSLRWLEKWREGAQSKDSELNTPLQSEEDSADEQMSSNERKDSMEILNVFDSFLSLHENLEIACGGRQGNAAA